MGKMPLAEVAFSRLSPLAFWAGVGVLLLALLLGEVPWAALLLLYPWWRLGRGFRLALFPQHLEVHPPLGFRRRIPLAQVREVEVAFWSAGPLARGRPALFLGLEGGERLPLPLPEPEAWRERIRALLAGQTSGSGSRDG